MARKFARDNRGRFTSGGGGATARGGRLRTASGGKRKTVTAKLRSPATAGALGRKQPKPKRPANKISRTGKRLGTDKRPANAIRRGPKSPDTRLDRALRDMSNTIKDAQPKLRQARKDLEQMNRQMERMFAKPLEDRLKDSVDGRLSSLYMRAHGSEGNAAGKDVIRRRAARAAAAAGRGSKAGKRAQQIYGNQLAGLPRGSVNAANNIAPGRRSKPKGPGKKKRGRRKK